MARPRKHPEGATAADRLRASTQARRAAGWVKVDLWLPPPAAADLAEIAEATGETRAKIIGRLVRSGGRRSMSTAPRDGTRILVEAELASADYGNALNGYVVVVWDVSSQAWRLSPDETAIECLVTTADMGLAIAAYEHAVRRAPNARLMMRQGGRIMRRSYETTKAASGEAGGS